MHPTSSVRIRPWFVAVTAALYAILGELLYRDSAFAAGPGGGCTRGSAVNFHALAVAVGLLVFIVSSAVLARRAARPWAGTTALHAGVAIAAGMILGRMIFRARLEAAPPCPGLDFCGGFGCMARPFDDFLIGLVLVASACVLAVPVGWLARRLAPPGTDPAPAAPR